MSRRAYPHYRPSGSEWLGEIPEHWAVKRLKYAASINDEALPETTDPGYEFSYVDIGNVDAVNGIVAEESYLFENAPSRARRIVRDGDTIVSTVRTYLRAIAPIREPEDHLIVSTGFAVVRPREVEPDYLSFALRSPYFVETLVSRSTGVSYPAINASEVGTIAITIPALDEQRAIAAFLDRETARIDVLIEKKQRQIELLQEKRAALISHAVTRGLDPHAPLKDSGIEWLGEVPAHWDVRQLRYVVMFQRGHDLTADDRMDGTVPVVTSAGITATHSVSKATGPGIVTGRYGTIGKFHYIAEDYWPHNTSLYSINTYGNNVKFLWYLSQSISALFLLNSAKSAVPGVDRNDLHPVKVAVPPIEEQKTIADFLDGEWHRTEVLTEKASESIAVLREYRTALISAAVTGKIDVREEVA